MTTARAVVACVGWLLGAVACNRIDYAAGPLPTAPPLPPLAEPPSQVTQGRAVLFAFHEQHAVPLYCHDRGQRRFGADCAGLLPNHIEARLTSSVVTTLRPLPGSSCTASGKPVPMFEMAEPAAAGSEQLAALWSDAVHSVMIVPPVPAEHMPETPSQLRGMTDACRKLTGPAPIGPGARAEPLTTWLVDLDGDGVRERLDDVRCVDGATKQMAAQVIFLTPGRRPERTVPLRLSQTATTSVRIDVVTDVDSNGVPEIVVSTVSATSHRIELGHLNNTGLETLTEIVCTSGPRRRP